MRIVRILSLICFVAAVFFGAAQLFNHMRDSMDDLTLLSLWQRVSGGNGDGIRSLLPNGVAQDVFTAILATPAWLALLCLGGGLWMLDRAISDED
jgi:hypothetical protein